MNDEKATNPNIVTVTVTVTVTVLAEPKSPFDGMVELHQAYLRAEAAGYADEFMMLEQDHYDRTRRYRTSEQRALDPTVLLKPGEPN